MPQALRTLLRTTPRTLRPARSYHTTSLRLAYKDSQDRNSLRPGSTENTKTARDDDAAQHDAAFNPDKTSPEAAAEETSQSSQINKGAGDKQDPLEASAANQGLNKPMGDEETIKKTGAGKETQKGGKSEGKSSEKRGTPGRD
ncbi:Fc.00g039130.m01.CDS01 [Cosmosporella sp. VM-42]